ncbi:hypothetical protein D3C85_1363230 [compost metagenome]
MCDAAAELEAFFQVEVVDVRSLESKTSVRSRRIIRIVPCLFRIDLHDVNREGEQIVLLGKEQRTVITQQLRVGSPITDQFFEFFLRIIHIGNIEQRHFHPLVIGDRLGSFHVDLDGIFPEANDMVLIVWMQIVAVARDF